MTVWLSIVSAALTIISGLVGYFKDKKLIEAATAEVLAAHLKGALDEIQRADAVRDSVRKHFTADLLPSDDPNRRD